mmetsp:Transcript_26389/g.40506  ORF Transcript_26389/g.40506 Transcript_26389/m.40506 type:complete len:352 (-) Transcript_26389:287-1342(-)|eukprot:CAMPEP_0195288022 /NCGR_PEP_ID=MMETSP0707-20130614/4850_1 /TAXON_ID=33640 /ORGANISM="Asterionellopsis glacialis, Strain CCMP134" /LENGTH=351 /DNA_ID=CAMNT_0040347839 /DNA_START=217 /DNA_END=1272 /DNA_ORIENTATION=-
MSDTFEDVNITTETPSSPAVKTIDDIVAATPSAEGGVLNETTIVHEDDEDGFDEKNSLTPTRTGTFCEGDQQQRQTPTTIPEEQEQQQHQPGTPDDPNNDKDSLLNVIFGSCTGGVVSAQTIFSQCRGKVREGFKSTKIDTRNVGVYPPNGNKPNMTSRQQRRAAAAAAAAANVPFIVQKKDTSGGSDTNGSGTGGGMASDAHGDDCDDSISAISALTLDEMAKFHHQSNIIMKDMRCNSRLKSPQNTTSTTLASSTTGGGGGIGENEESVTERLSRYNFPFAISKARSSDSKQQSLAETSGSSSAGGAAADGADERPTKASLKNIQQHDKLMSEMSNELQFQEGEKNTPW